MSPNDGRNIIPSSSNTNGSFISNNNGSTSSARKNISGNGNWGQRVHSLFQNIWWSVSKATTTTTTRNTPGTIWYGNDAMKAYENGELCSIDEKETTSITTNLPLRVVFRNLTPIPLLLCWISKDGQLHHFYRLDPWKRPTNNIVLQNSNNVENHDNVMALNDNTDIDDNNDVFMKYMTKQDHIELTQTGDAFCIAYIPEYKNEQIWTRIRAMKSLEIRDSKTKTNSNGHKRSLFSDKSQILESKSTKLAATVIGGYRPDIPSPINNDDDTTTTTKMSTTTISDKSNVQLITISYREESNNNDIPCWLQSCFGKEPTNKHYLKKTQKLVEVESQRTESENDDFSQQSSYNIKGWKVSAQWANFDMSPVDTSKKVYKQQTIGGWPCCVEPDWSNGDKELERLLTKDIEHACKRLPLHARKYLQKNCEIWINKSLSWGPKACPVRGQGCCYHPNQKWLISNGLCTDKHMCVEINCASDYKQSRQLWGCGGVILHEMSHAYHHRMLPDGYSNKEIDECYNAAIKDGLYDSVPVKGRQGPTAKAYACTNRMEYWAELSCAFLGGINKNEEFNKWYPFNRFQIQKHDPRAYSLLCRLWKPDAIEI